MRKITKKLLSVSAAVFVAAGAAGVAYAEGWLTFGTGHGEAVAATVQPLDVTIDTDPLTKLYPNGSVTTTLHIDNVNNGFPVTVQELNVLGIHVDDFHRAAGCAGTVLTFTGPAVLPTIAAGAAQDVVGQVSMAGNAPAACQSALFGFASEAKACVG